MLVTNFHLKRLLYVVMCGFRQLRDVAEVHPARRDGRVARIGPNGRRSIERQMPDALWPGEASRPAGRFPRPGPPSMAPDVEFGAFTGGARHDPQPSTSRGGTCMVFDELRGPSGGIVPDSTSAPGPLIAMAGCPASSTNVTRAQGMVRRHHSGTEGQQPWPSRLHAYRL